MPKIIKDIKGKILVAALNLFDSIGYENVDMRKVAKEANIAVGTLYNHYPNKEVLFLSALQSSWRETINKLITQMSSDNKSYDQIEMFVTTLYDSIVDRKGLGKELLLQGLIKDKDDGALNTMTTVFAEIKDILKPIVIEHYKEEKQDISLVSRKINTVISVVGQLTENYSDERDININYLISLLLWRS